MAFRGTFEHSLDDRGRLAIPSRYRDQFADGGVLTPSPDGCLELYPLRTFEDTAQDLTAERASHQRGRRLRRGLYARSWDVELDKQGRILIPQLLRNEAELTGTAVVAGRRECLEIWSQPRWENELRVVNREYAANLEAQESTSE